MPTIIRDLPYFDKETNITVRGRVYPVFSYQIVLWVSISPKGLDTLDTSTPRFPAVLDTGFTHNFLIQPDQLKSWAGLMPDHLKPLGQFRAHGELVPLHAANVWLHPNASGERDQFSGAPPFRVELDLGIGICPSAMQRPPRLPLLGIRGLDRADLDVLFHHRRRVTIRTARWFWFFG